MAGKDLAGQVVIVTGASAGIGAATARELARRGAQVVLVARGADRLASRAEAIVAAGGYALAVPGDVADLRQITEVVRRPRREVYVPRFYRATVWVEQIAPWVWDLVARTAMMGQEPNSGRPEG